MAGGGSNPTRAILWAFGANLGIALAKSGAFFFTGSSSMLAESIHSFADTGNQLLLLLGMNRAKQAPDAEPPLGYGKATYFWSFVVALLLFSVGGLFSIYEGMHKLHEQGPIENAWIALGVLGFSIVLESLSMRGCLQEINKLRGRKPLWRWLRESRSAELVVVFGEDLAALLGLTLAFAFVGLALLTGDRVYDAYGSLAIGVLLVVVAVLVAERISKLLIGRSADPGLTEALRAEIARDPAVAQLLRLITLQIGPDVMLAVKLRVQDGTSLPDAIAQVNALERRLKTEHPSLRWSFVELDDAD
jgi:cation diffusion facilitator family transporter